MNKMAQRLTNHDALVAAQNDLALRVALEVEEAFVDGVLQNPDPLCARRLLSVKYNMGGGRVAHPVLKGPSVVKELVIGAVLGLAAGGLWKMHHWNEQRKTRAFYDLLEKGEISVVVDEE
ncbi:cytochrome c oxidase subunit 5C-2 [Tanacetum coccineum]